MMSQIVKIKWTLWFHQSKSAVTVQKQFCGISKGITKKNVNLQVA
jgi:hypothetical protein